MIGDVVERRAGLVVLGIEEVLDVVGIVAGHGQGEAHELGVGAGAMDAFNDRVVLLGVELRGGFVLELDFVQHFPHRKFVVIAGVMLHAVLVFEAAVRCSS